MDFSLVMIQVHLVYSWMARKPYDVATCKLTPEWKQASRVWDSSQDTAEPSEWAEFFIAGLSLRSVPKTEQASPSPSQAVATSTGPVHHVVSDASPLPTSAEVDRLKQPLSSEVETAAEPVTEKSPSQTEKCNEERGCQIDSEQTSAKHSRVEDHLPEEETLDEREGILGDLAWLDDGQSGPDQDSYSPTTTWDDAYLRESEELTEGEVASSPKEAAWEREESIGAEFDFANREEELEWFRHALGVERDNFGHRATKGAHQVTIGQQSRIQAQRAIPRI